MAPRVLAICHTCRLKHLAAPGSDEAAEFFARHKGHRIGAEVPSARVMKVHRLLGVDLFRPLARKVGEWLIGVDRLGYEGYGDNANVKQAFAGESAFDLTSFNSLASSVTAGWQSAYNDNTSNLYDDALVFFTFATGGSVSSQKAIFLYGYGATDTSNFPNTGASSGGGTGASSSVGGSLTFLDVTANPCPLPLLLTMPTITSSIAYTTPAFSVARGFGGILPPYWGIGLINASGWTFAASSNVGKWDGVYYTVV